MSSLIEQAAEGKGAWDHSVKGRLRIIQKTLEKNKKLSDQLPGLKLLLDLYLSGEDLNGEEIIRRLLRVFKDAPEDGTYSERLQRFPPELKEIISRFVDGNGIHDISRELKLGEFPDGDLSLIAEAARGEPPPPRGVKVVLREGFGASGSHDHPYVNDLVTHFAAGKDAPNTVQIFHNQVFQNWGRVVEYQPLYTCVPSSVEAIMGIVKIAKDHNIGIRCSGYRHSWAPIFGKDKQILISMLEPKEVDDLPNCTALTELSIANELQSINIVAGSPRVEGNTLIRVGASVTNERLRRWCKQNKQYTLPLNVIMVEITVGGTNGPICHGAGINHQTLSDLVRCVEYVDCNGNFQKVDDPEQLRAASGCFGLMGVVTHLTLEFAPMTYALTHPAKKPVVRAVPPPDDLPTSQIPPALRIKGWTEEQKQQDVQEFEKQCRNKYYAEWFWFPYSDEVWINCWDHTNEQGGDSGKVEEEYPSKEVILFQILSQFTLDIIQHAGIIEQLIKATHLAEAAVTFLSWVAMQVMPTKAVKAYLPDALHFQRGIHNLRVLDIEVEIPIPAKKGSTDTPDFNVVRRAWWDAILKCYEHRKKSPQRMPLEMRIMGDSNAIMAPQRGNRLGTCSIEVLTLRSAREIWVPYAQEVLDQWMSYKGSDGKQLRTRPHWAKQWIEFRVNGKPWAQHLKGEYAEEIKEFRRLLGEIGSGHGWTLGDIRRRFSNDVLDGLYFDGFDD